MASSLLYREVVLPDPTPEPVAGSISGIVLSIISVAVLSGFLTQRSLAVKSWRRLPFIVWVVFAIFVDSWLFVFVTAILHYGIGFSSNLSVCSAAIFLCLVCYVTTKLIYLFLVEKAFVIRGGTKKRLQSKLYIFNSFGMLSVYVAVSILNFVYRITRMDNGECVIGMEKYTMIPLISFDLLVNVYLTMLFLIPLSCLYSFKNLPRTNANIRLRTVALRTFIGTLCTTTSSVVNLTVLMVLNGEPGWVCLMCCNSDILFSAIVIQWVTSRDNAATADNNNNNLCYFPRPSPSGSGGGGSGGGSGNGISRANTSPSTSTTPSALARNPPPRAHTAPAGDTDAGADDKRLRRSTSAKHGMRETVVPLRSVASEAALIRASRSNSGGSTADEGTLGDGDDEEEGGSGPRDAAVVEVGIAHVRLGYYGAGRERDR